MNFGRNIKNNIKPLQSEGENLMSKKNKREHEKIITTKMIEILEGGWETHHDKNDVGGVTRAGIASRYYPELDLDNMSKEDIINFYLDEWYSKVENISFQGLRDYIFMTGLNTGLRPMVRLLQATLNQLDVNVERISEDGIYGPATDRKLKNTCLSLRASNPTLWNTILFDRLNHNVYSYYSQRGTARHHFLGWFNRIQRTMTILFAHSNMSDDFLVERGMKK